jgi:hypothetical protein
VNSNSYLSNIVKKYSVLGEERLKFQAKTRPLQRELRRWANQYIDKIIPSGSFLKGTAIKGAADIDLLISLKNQAPFTLKEIYESLYDFLNQSYSAQKQNVSIGIIYQGIKVDLVPAKKQPNVTHPHSIYVSKQDTWTKTNINMHINLIKKSPHRNVIKLLKIWSKLNRLDFSSFVLEMTVLEVLRKKRVLGIDKKFLSVLEYIIEEFEYAKIYDPANTNNVISDSISNDQKDRIIQAAITSYHSEFWENIVWGLYEKRI